MNAFQHALFELTQSDSNAFHLQQDSRDSHHNSKYNHHHHLALGGGGGGGGGSGMDQPLDFSVKSPSSPGGESFCSHTSSRNKRSSSNGTIIKDDQYWLRREKNNQAAKRSRDARRQKEEQTKAENQILREENEKLKYRVKALQEHITHCPHSGLAWKQDE